MTETSSEAETSFQQAVEAFNSSNLDLAIDVFKTTISLSPDHADAYNYLGQAYFKKEEYQNSVDCFNKALEIEPTHTQARGNLEIAQWKLDNLNKTVSESTENIERTVEGDSENNEDDPWNILREQALGLPPEQLLEVFKSAEAKSSDTLSDEQLGALQDFYSHLGKEIRADKERTEIRKYV